MERCAGYVTTPTVPVAIEPVATETGLAQWELRLLKAARAIRAHSNRRGAMMVQWDGPAQSISVIKRVDEHRD